MASADAELRESEARLRALVESAVDGIVTIDAAGIVESYNPAAERIFGWAADEVIGKNISMLMPEPHRSAHDGYLQRYLETGERKIIGIGREVWAQRKDGSSVPIDLAVAEVKTHGRRTFLGIVRDLTERRQEGLRSARLALDAHQQGRVETAAGILHDIGNALTGIGARAVEVQGGVQRACGAEEMIRKTAAFLQANGPKLEGALGPAKAAALVDLMNAVGSTQSKALNEALESLAKLFALLSHTQDVLSLHRSYSRAGSGPQRERVSLKKILFDAQLMMSDVAAKRGGVVSVRFGERVPHVRLERTKLMQALMNLVKNAAEAFDGAELERTPEITLFAEAHEGGARVEVQDNGPGFEPAEGEQLFADGYTTKSRGSGLGLGAARQVVRALGGELDLSSEGAGKGAVARITLPREVVDDADG
jgi:two-component system sensor kinase FixL